MFTLSALRQLPNLVMAAPRDEQQLRRLLRTAFAQEHPFAIQYPRDSGLDLPAVEPEPVEVGSGEVLREGRDILILGLGPIISRAREATEALEREGWSVAIADARFVRPLDRDLILESAWGKRLIVTLEESVLPGGFGSAVLEVLADAAATRAEAEIAAVPVMRIGIPGGSFVDHGSVSDLRHLLGIDSEGIETQIREAIVEHAISPAEPVAAGA
jgi:1-deoxy-D-xylulose-5-phosphate synthase